MGAGGGGSGAVEIPEYVRHVHNRFLQLAEAEQVTHSISYYINQFQQDENRNPYNNKSAFSSAAAVADIETEIDAFDTTVNAFMSNPDLSNMMSDFVSETRITDEVDAFTDILDSDYNMKVLPAFEAGMRDINAVMTSAFVIGKANIIIERGKQVAQFTADLRFRARGAELLQVVTLHMQLQQAVMNAHVEKNKLAISAGIDEQQQNLEIAVKKALWQIELFQHGGNLLAAYHGGVAAPGNKLSKGQSALAGATTGAGVGYMVGGPYGAAAGAVIGGVGGYLAA